MASTREAPREVTDPMATRPAERPLLVALDLDGTCVDAQLRLHPRTVAAAHTASAAGVTVVVATGRMYRSALPWAEKLGVTAPLICYQGAMVREMPDAQSRERDGLRLGALISEDALDPPTAQAALRIARREGWHFQAYQDELLLCEQDRPEAHQYARIAQVPITFVDDLQPLLAAGSIKVACVIDDETEAHRAELLMRAELGDGVRVVRSLPPFVEITHSRATKGRALRHLCARLSIPLARVAAVGDAPNDTDMLELASYAVAVRGAQAEVLAVADAICAPPDEAGVADVLEALVLR